MRVLFVSKPVVPPWNDGSKNLVRDIARNLVHARPTVMVSPGAPPLGGSVIEETVYGETGSFAPSLTANSRVLARLLLGDPHDVWHFVFAPNPASSSAAWLAKSTRRRGGWKGMVVQTIASAPKSFRGSRRLLFGDVVVAQSEHTRARLLASGVSAHALRVIPPCAEAPRSRTPDEMERAREAVGVPARAPLVLYPGDLEVSTGAATVAGAVREIVNEHPEAYVVFACRRKTSRAEAAENELRNELRDLGARTRFAGDVPDMHALLHAAHVVAMPVDDLYGKVDVPLVVLEALSLGKPLVLARGGPLEGVVTARFVEPGDSSALAKEVSLVLSGDAAALSDARDGVRIYRERFSPSVVAAAYEDLYRSATG